VSDSFEAQIATIRHRFIDRATIQSARLEGIAYELDDGGVLSELRAEIRSIAHSLAGAGGTFGFLEISALASELDEFARLLPKPFEVAGACRALVLEIRRSTF
jgi:hypothetical protein